MWAKENRFRLCHALAEILQIYAAHKLTLHVQVRLQYDLWTTTDNAS